MSNSRRKFTAEQKVRILREHLENQIPVSTICERYHIHPNVFYRWKKQLFEGALAIFSAQVKKNTDARINLPGEKRAHQVAWDFQESLL
ncbi:MAG TPA: transposase [Calditrichaeota bacterium]|nr:transposase [Calditrichota bacterium]